MLFPDCPLESVTARIKDMNDWNHCWELAESYKERDGLESRPFYRAFCEVILKTDPEINDKIQDKIKDKQHIKEVRSSGYDYVKSWRFRNKDKVKAQNRRAYHRRKLRLAQSES